MILLNILKRILFLKWDIAMETRITEDFSGRP